MGVMSRQRGVGGWACSRGPVARPPPCVFRRGFGVRRRRSHPPQPQPTAGASIGTWAHERGSACATIKRLRAGPSRAARVRSAQGLHRRRVLADPLSRCLFTSTTSTLLPPESRFRSYSSRAREGGGVSCKGCSARGGVVVVPAEVARRRAYRPHSAARRGRTFSTLFFPWLDCSGPRARRGSPSCTVLAPRLVRVPA